MGEKAFFQIAVALIPVLLFGGVLVSRRPLRQEGANSKAGGSFALNLLPALGLIAIFAEILAIKGAITGHHSLFERIVVIAAILLGMVAIVLTATYELNPGALKWQVAAVVALAIFGGIQLNEAVRNGFAEVQIRRAKQVGKELEGAYRQEVANFHNENRIEAKIARLEAKGRLSPAEKAELRNVKAERKIAGQTTKLVLNRIVELESRQVHIYENTFPP